MPIVFLYFERGIAQNQTEFDYNYFKSYLFPNIPRTCSAFHMPSDQSLFRTEDNRLDSFYFGDSLSDSNIYKDIWKKSTETLSLLQRAIKITDHGHCGM